MTAVTVQTFGGLLPAVEPRALPPEAAQVAHNLDMRHGDFRPVRGPGTPLIDHVVSGARAIFRTPTGDWISSVTDADYVLGQLHDTPDERVYLTGRNPYPEVWQDGAYRRLGVPSPATPPTCALVPNEEFTTEEAEAGRKAVITQFTGAIGNALSQAYAGFANTIAALPRGAFWLPHGTVANMGTNDDRMGAYCLPIVAAGSSFKMVHEQDNWALDPSFGSQQITYLGNPYLAIPLYCRATILSFNSTTFSTAAAAIKQPDNPALQLLTSDEISNLAAKYAAMFDVTQSPQKGMISELQLHIDRVAAAINPVSGSMLVEANKAFFAKADVVSEIDTAIANFAESVFLAAKTAFNVPSSAYVHQDPPGGP